MDGERGLDRREFVATATRATAALAVGGVMGLASCGDDAPLVHSTRSDKAGTASPPTGSSVDGVAWRLSTRRQHAPCNACKAHAAHRFFASSEAADSGRAHPGCSCDIVPQRATAQQLEAWFRGSPGDVHDDRWAS